MITLFYSVLTNSLNITLFILLLIFLEPLIKKHFSAVCLYHMWILLLLGMLIPTRFEFTRSLFSFSIPRITVENKASQADDQAQNVTMDKKEASYLPKLQQSGKHQDSIPAIKSSHLTEQWFPLKIVHKFKDWSFLLFAIWLSGGILLLIGKGIQHKRFITQLKRFMIPIDKEDLQADFLQCFKEINNDCRKSFSGCKNITVYQCPLLSTPVSYGIIKPIILLPEETFSKRELHFLFKHELVHILRRDSLIKLLHFIMISFNWFNPLSYVLSRHLDNWCEISCDAIVLNQSAKSDCMDYSKLLLKCAAANPAPELLLINLYGGKKNMKHRLCSIMNQNKKRPGRLLLTVFLGILSTTALITFTDHKNASASAQNLKVITNSAGKQYEKTEKIELSSKKNAPGKSGSANTNKAPDAEAQRKAVVKYAEQAKKTSYLWGGNNLKTGVDCSGLVQAVYKEIGVDLPRTTMQQLQECTKVSFDKLLPGDLIFYKSSANDTVSHVGIYIGNKQIIHAKNARVNVVVSAYDYRTPYYAGRIITN